MTYDLFLNTDFPWRCHQSCQWCGECQRQGWRCSQRTARGQTCGAEDNRLVPVVDKIVYKSWVGGGWYCNLFVQKMYIEARYPNTAWNIYVSFLFYSPEDDQSILIELSPPVLLRTNHYSIWEFHMVSPQKVFTYLLLLIIIRILFCYRIKQSWGLILWTMSPRPKSEGIYIPGIYARCWSKWKTPVFTEDVVFGNFPELKNHTFLVHHLIFNKSLFMYIQQVSWKDIFPLKNSPLKLPGAPTLFTRFALNRRDRRPLQSPRSLRQWPPGAAPTGPEPRPECGWEPGHALALAGRRREEGTHPGEGNHHPGATGTRPGADRKHQGDHCKIRVTKGGLGGHGRTFPPQLWTRWSGFQSNPGYHVNLVSVT